MSCLSYCFSLFLHISLSLSLSISLSLSLQIPGAASSFGARWGCGRLSWWKNSETILVSARLRTDNALSWMLNSFFLIVTLFLLCLASSSLVHWLLFTNFHFLCFIFPQPFYSGNSTAFSPPAQVRLPPLDGNMRVCRFLLSCADCSLGMLIAIVEADIFRKHARSIAMLAVQAHVVKFLPYFAL